MRADFLGPGWGSWQGGWQGQTRLVCHRGSWHLEEAGRELARWSDGAEAFRQLWQTRRTRDSRPWAIGWIGYEETARMAGGLPFSDDPCGVPDGCLILEPDSIEPAPAGKIFPTANGSSARWSLGFADFCEGVSEIRERIASGSVYQVNLCRRLTVDGWEASLEPLELAATRNGVPDYLAKIQFDEGELLCTSMEMLLRRRVETLETRPIKGTRPRGESHKEDRRLAAELDADSKELAELAMIVDLERNDLGRIAEVGSVRVQDPGSVHSYPNVHHRVARIVGKALPGLEWWEALAKMAPGGSVTGCPKRAAMSTIASLEPVSRGPFTGTLGVVAGNGDMEWALPIRTAWRIGSRLEFAAGCGIVWQSDPESEERESRLKIGPWLELVGIPQ